MPFIHMNKKTTAQVDAIKTAIDGVIQKPLTLEQARKVLQELIEYIEMTDDAVKDDIRRRNEEG